MALIDIKLFSTTLCTNTDVRVIVPTPDEPFVPDDTPFYKPNKRYQVLYLLHGAFGDCSVWTRNTGVERYAQEHKLMVVSASVTNSCYLDMTYGGDYLTYMIRELPAFINSVFPTSTKREDTFIAGLSMGGYGAYRIALEQPERFACAVSLSGALDLYCDEAPKSQYNFRSPLRQELICGGDKDKQRENELFSLIEKRMEEGRELPRFYQSCGTEDFIYGTNIFAHEKMQKLGIDLTYREREGAHNWDYWDPEIRYVLSSWLPLANTLVDG